MPIDLTKDEHTAEEWQKLYTKMAAALAEGFCPVHEKPLTEHGFCQLCKPNGDDYGSWWHLCKNDPQAQEGLPAIVQTSWIVVRFLVHPCTGCGKEFK